MKHFCYHYDTSNTYSGVHVCDCQIYTPGNHSAHGCLKPHSKEAIRALESVSESPDIRPEEK